MRFLHPLFSTWNRCDGCNPWPRDRGVNFAALSHAAGLSSTGDADLDRRLPFDEFYRIPHSCAAAIEAAKSRSGRVIAIGTSVVRALESAANADGTVRAERADASLAAHRSVL
jgi:S-adenosylmethionine:tRNA ribosyltransferase-isomerase